MKGIIRVQLCYCSHRTIYPLGELAYAIYEKRTYQNEEYFTYGHIGYNGSGIMSHIGTTYFNYNEDGWTNYKL